MRVCGQYGGLEFESVQGVRVCGQYGGLEFESVQGVLCPIYKVHSSYTSAVNAPGVTELMEYQVFLVK